MAIAVCCIAIFKRIHLPPILAYLFAGILAGPSVLNLFAHVEQMHLLAEIGIVFLLFSLGLEFSLPKLLAMRHMVFGAGAMQMLLTTGVFALLAVAAELPLSAAIVVGGMVALSSTAIVIKQVTEMGILNQQRAQLAISILLFQDLAVVPFLIVIPLLAQDAHTSFSLALLFALVKGVVVVAILMSAGKWLLPWVFREVARTRTDELFVLTTILVALLAAGLTYAFGLSMALGAFLAGMMLGESKYKYQLEADIRPFRDILMGLFFVTVGMQLEVAVMMDYGVWIMLGVILLMIMKVVLVRMAAGFFHLSGGDAWAAGFKLCQIGEFSFVIAALARSHEVITPMQSSVLVCMGVISMALTPWLIEQSVTFANKLSSRERANMAAEVVNDETIAMEDHIVVCGFGRVGQSVARMLKLEGITPLVIDIDPVRVLESRNAGELVIFGDAASKDILHNAGIDSCKLVLITFDHPLKAAQVISAVRQLSTQVEIMVRTQKDHDLEQLYNAGANHVVPELQEGSLMLISQILHHAGVPMSRILKRVRAERKGRYDHLRGFYPGDTTDISATTQDKLEFIHAVVLSANAYAIGKTLDELDIGRRRVSIKGLRRNGKETSTPNRQEVLARGDVLIIAGKPRRVERIERYLLEGV
jgi:CPA2 family monovalent cation:H+ antiporter-2